MLPNVSLPNGSKGVEKIIEKEDLYNQDIIKLKMLLRMYWSAYPMVIRTSRVLADTKFLLGNVKDASTKRITTLQ